MAYSIRPGKPWPDTDGKGTVWHWGVRLYASPKAAAPLPGIEIKHGENTSISRYVWLPIKWQGDKPVIRWRNEWHTEKLG